ncbi:MAG: hypothetical protein FJY92_08255, partial [Candidatus Hydrogenedentes bacterium]|nr:hypothetical protein [Candidatus Hydrogenedentota bacterium]
MTNINRTAPIVLIVFAVFGCSQPVTPPDSASSQQPVPPPLSPVAASPNSTPSAVSAPAPAVPAAQDAAPGPDKAEKPAAPSAAPEPPAYDASLVSNGSFETKDDTGRPNGWIVSPLEIIDRTAAGEAAEGKEFLGLKGVKGNWGVIAENLTPTPSLLERELRIEAWGKAVEANKMSLALLYDEDGKEIEVEKKYWSKTGNSWEKLEFVIAVPKTADVKTLRLRALLPEGSKPGYALDGIRAVIDFAGPNSGLDDVDDTGRPGGWILSPPEAAATDAKLEPAEGKHAIALRALDNSWGLLAHELKVSSADLGQTIVVAAEGYADEINNLK